MLITNSDAQWSCDIGYSTELISRIIKSAEEKTNINKCVYHHIFLYSYAIHNLEQEHQIYIFIFKIFIFVVELMTKINIHIKNDILKITFLVLNPENILDELAQETIKMYRNNKKKIKNIILDFSEIKFINIESALSLISFFSAIKRKNINTNFHYIYPPENVLRYLMIIGFFGQMSTKVGILEGQNILRHESKMKQERKSKEKVYYNGTKLKPVIFPIATIPQMIETNSGRDFENIVGNFVNQIIDTFNIIFSTPHFNFDEKGRHNFILSNVELFKNIFEHSNSWGIASIHARPDLGTTVCFYDIGIGFKKSVMKFDTECESIEWALVDGNTSKPEGDNDGFGLSIVKTFVLERNGKLKIRSGDCLFEISSNSILKRKVQKFPGAQITYFIPIKFYIIK